MRTFPRVALAILVAVGILAIGNSQAAADGSDGCRRGSCPQVEADRGSLVAKYFAVRGGVGFASNATDKPPLYQWQLRSQCEISDPNTGACDPQAITCSVPPDRLVAYYVVQSQRLVQADGSPVGDVPPPPGQALGTGYAQWETVFAGCVDVTDLDPAPSPSPDEVYRYLRTLPLPKLPTRQQPPGNGLANLPVIFFTDGPTTQTFTLNIRGFTTVITATATAFTWHTGDGTDQTSTTPGAPYPHQTVTHDYRAGTYTASLTTTWTATFTVNGGPSTPVPGSTTTDGPPTTFSIREAHAVLTNPSD